MIRNSHADATDDQISSPIKIWLAHAKERAAKEKSDIWWIKYVLIVPKVQVVNIEISLIFTTCNAKNIVYYNILNNIL